MGLLHKCFWRHYNWFLTPSALSLLEMVSGYSGAHKELPMSSFFFHRIGYLPFLVGLPQFWMPWELLKDGKGVTWSLWDWLSVYWQISILCEEVKPFTFLCEPWLHKTVMHSTSLRRVLLCKEPWTGSKPGRTSEFLSLSQTKKCEEWRGKREMEI